MTTQTINFEPQGASAEQFLPGNKKLPVEGWRNYWYPGLEVWRLGRKPKAIRLLGEDIVLYRDGAKLFALADRCPHRGAKLSMGKCLYPGSGTISCPYHGWTFKGDDGKCVAKLVEGPDASIPPQAKVKSYPVREHVGVIWVFVGDMDLVELDVDLPEPIAKNDLWHSISNWRTYHCNWRHLQDNLSYDHHEPYLHRTSPEFILQPVFPFATKNATEPLEDGRGIGYKALAGIRKAEYPGLGTFPPKQEWYRLMKPTGRGEENGDSSPALTKYGMKYRVTSLLPSIHMIGRPTGDFFTCRWVVPLDAKTSQLWNFNLYRRKSTLHTLWDRFIWLVWKSWAHDWLFSDQDKWLAEKIVDGPELLSRTDIGVTALRRYAVQNARRPKADESKQQTAGEKEEAI